VLSVVVRNMFWRHIIVFCLFLGLCLAALGFIVAVQTKKIAATDHQVQLTHHIIEESQNLVIYVKSMLVEQRGYLLTDARESLRQYEEKKILATRNIVSLRDLVADNPSQVSRIDEIQYNFLKLSDNLDEASRNFQEGIAVKITDMAIVNKLKDDIGSLSNDLLAEEYELLEVRVSILQGQRYQYILIFIISGAFVAMMLIVLNVFMFFL